MGETIDARRRGSKPIIFGAAVGLVVGLATAAVAAAITLTTASSFGAGSVLIPAPCDTSYSVTLGAPAWNAGTSTYTISGFDISGVDAAACTTSNIQVNVLNSSGTSLGDALTIASDGTYVLSAPVDAAAAAEIVSVIYVP